MLNKEICKEKTVALVCGYLPVIAFPEIEFQLTIPPSQNEEPTIDTAYARGKELGALSLMNRRNDDEPIA